MWSSWVIGLALLGLLIAAPKVNRPKDCFPHKEPDCKILKIAQAGHPGGVEYFQSRPAL